MGKTIYVGRDLTIKDVIDVACGWSERALMSLSSAAWTEDSDEEIVIAKHELSRDVYSLEKMGRNPRALVVGEHSLGTS